MADIRDQYRQQFPNASEDELNQLMLNNSLPPTTQSPTVQQGGYNSVTAYNSAQDKYKAALEEIKSKRTIGNLNAALTSRFNPQRVQENNQRWDNEAALAKDATLGAYNNLDKAQENQETRQRNQMTDAWNVENQAQTRKKWSMDDVKNARERADQQQADDPNSDVSRIARDAATAKLNASGIKGINIDGMSKTQLDKISPAIKDATDAALVKYNQEENRRIRQQTAADNAAQRQLTREQTAALSAAANQTRQEQADETRVSKLSKDIAGAQAILAAVNNVEQEIKTLTGQKDFSLDSYDPVKETYGNGKTIDLPGVSIPLYGRSTLMQGDAKQLEGSIARVFNTELKDRSGAAVTTPEMERLKSEFGAGRYNNENEMIGALKRYKDLALQELQNREAGYSPDIKKQYEQQGGVTSSQYINSSNPTNNDPLGLRGK